MMMSSSICSKLLAIRNIDCFKALLLFFFFDKDLVFTQKQHEACRCKHVSGTDHNKKSNIVFVGHG